MIKSPLFESDEIKRLLGLFVKKYCDEQLKKTATTADATPETPVTNDSCLSISDSELTTSTSDDATSSPQSSSTSSSSSTQIDSQATNPNQNETNNEHDKSSLKSKWDKLEVYGSLHIRSNNIRLLSCLVDEQLNLNDMRINEIDVLLSHKYDQKTISTQTCTDMDVQDEILASTEKRKADMQQQQQQHQQQQKQCASSLSSMSPPLSYNSSNYEQNVQKTTSLEMLAKLENDENGIDEHKLDDNSGINGVHDQYPFNKKLKAYHQFYNKRKMSEPNKIINRNRNGNGIGASIGDDDDYLDDNNHNHSLTTANKIPMINKKKVKIHNKHRRSMTFGGRNQHHESRRNQNAALVQQQQHKNDDVDSYLNTSSYTTSLSSSRSRSPSTDRGSSILSKHNMSITMSLDRLSSSRSRSRSLISSRSLTSRSSSISSLNYSRRKLLKQSKELTMCASGPQSAQIATHAPPPTRAIMQNEQQRDLNTTTAAQQQQQQYLLDKQAIKCELNGFYMNESELNAINALAMNAVGSGLKSQNGGQIAGGQTMDTLFGPSNHHNHHLNHHHHNHHHHSLAPINQNKLLCKKQQYIMLSSQSRHHNNQHLNDGSASKYAHNGMQFANSGDHLDMQQKKHNSDRMSPVSDAGLHEYSEHKNQMVNTVTSKSLSPLSMSSSSVSATSPPISKSVNAAAAVLAAAAAAQQQQQNSLIKQQQQQHQQQQPNHLATSVAALLADMQTSQHQQQQAAVAAHLASVNNALHMSRYANSTSQSELMAAVLAQQQRSNMEQQHAQHHSNENGSTNGRLNGNFYSRYTNSSSNRRINSTHDGELNNTSSSGVTNALTPNSTDEYVPKYSAVLQDHNDDEPSVKTKERDNNEKVRLSPGYDVFISVNDLNACNDDRGSATRLLRNLMDVFFDKSTLAKSSINGTGRITNTLDKHVISALFAYVKHRYPDVPHSQLTRAATDKCVQTRRNFRKKIKAAQSYFGMFPSM